MKNSFKKNEQLLLKYVDDYALKFPQDFEKSTQKQLHQTRNSIGNKTNFTTKNFKISLRNSSFLIA